MRGSPASSGHCMLAKVKGTDGIELTGKTESATAAMHDTLKLGAHHEAMLKLTALMKAVGDNMGLVL